ncbi:ATP-dependent zinc protease family protein, partial [Vibrio parahaemolyticus]
DLHPDVYHLEQVVRCTAKLKANRKVKSSNGTFEHRCVITTMLRLSDQEWPIDITLTNREKMTYMMLLGRQGMADKVLVDPSQSHLLAS